MKCFLSLTSVLARSTCYLLIESVGQNNYDNLIIIIIESTHDTYLNGERRMQNDYTVIDLSCLNLVANSVLILILVWIQTFEYKLCSNINLFIIINKTFSLKTMIQNWHTKNLEQRVRNERWEVRPRTSTMCLCASDLIRRLAYYTIICSYSRPLNSVHSPRTLHLNSSHSLYNHIGK